MILAEKYHTHFEVSANNYLKEKTSIQVDPTDDQNPKKKHENTRK